MFYTDSAKHDDECPPGRESSFFRLQFRKWFHTAIDVRNFIHLPLYP